MAKGILGGSNGGMNRGFGAEIAFKSNGLAAEAFEGLKGECGLVTRETIGDGHVGSGLCQGQRNAASNAARTAGNEC